MKKAEEIETPLVYIERTPVMLLISSALTFIFGCFVWIFFKTVNPIGLIIMLIPAAFSLFNSIWLLLNPFALFYEERVEIKQSLFHSQQRFFIDIKKVSQDSKGNLFITYNDDEVEKLNLFGIRKPDIAVLKENLNRQLTTNLNKPAVDLN